MKGSGHGLIWSSVLIFVSRDWGKEKEYLSQVTSFRNEEENRGQAK
jgi:hypothetical protein